MQPAPSAAPAAANPLFTAIPTIVNAFQTVDGKMMPTPRTTVFRDGTATLMRFENAEGQHGQGATVLLVPSMINKWYVMDLRPGASMIDALVKQGLDVFCIDWGEPQAEDRYLSWDDVQERLARLMRATRRISGRAQIGVLGYCMGATLCAVAVARNQQGVSALINLAGPIDFSHSGVLGEMTDARWFDGDAIAAAGNITPTQMQSGFTAMRPTLQIGKWIGLVDRAEDVLAVDAFAAMETWANDNVPFPGAAYATYIRELYQGNLLVAGQHVACGKRVKLGDITCPVMVICASKDTICPPPAATALAERCGSEVKKVVTVPGGHVGAVIGSRASRDLYPAIGQFFAEHVPVA